MSNFFGAGFVPFIANSGHLRYWNEIIRENVPAVIVGKSRKWAFTTGEFGNILHTAMYSRGRICRIVAQRDQTIRELADLIHQLYSSAWETLNAVRPHGRGAGYYMPRNRSDSLLTFDFRAMGSKVYLETAAGHGVGQASRTDYLYITEYQEWRNASTKFDALVGSMPMAAKENRIVIDFNATEAWMGSDAFTVWAAANKPRGSDEWNRFHPFFVGVNDVPEWYPPHLLDEKRRQMRERFRLSYPEKPEDLYYQRGRAVHRIEDLEASRALTGGRYLVEVPEAHGLLATGRVPIVHGVDTATGRQDGDYQTCVSFGLYDDLWWELCEPLRERIPEDVFAAKVRDRVRQFPGLCAVERNVGSVVILKLREMGMTGNLYKHKSRDRAGKQKAEYGFPTSYSSKRQLIANMDHLLREDEHGKRHLGLRTPWLIDEFREVEYKTTASDSDTQAVAAAPDRADAFDDGWMAAGVALQAAYLEGVVGGWV